MPKELNDIFDGQNPQRIDGGIVFKRVIDNIDELTTDALAEIIGRLSPERVLAVMKQRCHGYQHGRNDDSISCDMYEQAMEGDPSAQQIDKALGIRGQCETGNSVSCDTLQRLENWDCDAREWQQ